MQNLVLQTKLQPPQLKGKILHRERLLKILKENLDKKLILICADAGYGKTTALVQLIKEENLPCVFYKLDKNDGDLSVFISHLIFGFKQVQEDLGVQTEKMLVQNGKLVSNYEFMFGTLINEFIEKRRGELFIVIDDYHILSEDSRVHKALEYFIEYLPDNIHVIIATRTIPPIPSIARWKLKQYLFELSREDLKFNEHEIKALLENIYNLTLTLEELKIIANQTEGWITGIQLILQYASRAKGAIKEKLIDIMEQEQSLFDYFTSELMSNEPLIIQDFLKKSSVLEVVTPEICDAVMEVKEARKILRDIQKRNIFISILGSNQYRYHPLFRHFLLNKLDPALKRNLYFKAAEYYREKKFFEQAIDYYVKAENYERAGELISQYGEMLIEQAKFFILEKWLNQIPDYVFDHYPRLLWLQSIIYHNDGKFDKALNLLNQIESYLLNQKDKTGLTQIFYEQGVIHWRCNRYKEALISLKKAIRICPASQIKLKERIYNLIGLTVWDCIGVKQAKHYLLKAQNLIKKLSDFHEHLTIEANLAMVDYELGNISKAFNSFHLLIAKIGTHYSYGRGTLFLNAVRIVLDYGDIDGAEKILNNGYTLCKDYNDPHSLAALNLASSLVYIEKQEWNKAEGYLKEALQKYLKLGINRYTGLTYLYYATLKNCQKNQKEAEYYLSQAYNYKGKSDDIFYVSLLIETCLLELLAGTYNKAKRTSVRCLNLAKRINSKSKMFETFLLRAAIMASTGKIDKGVQLLKQNIQVARKYGYGGILSRALKRIPHLFELSQLLLEQGNLKSSDANYLSGLIKKLSDMSAISEAIKLFVFGKPRIYKGKIEIGIKDLFVEKAAKLFVLFALHPDKRFSREELIEIFWPDTEPPKGGKNLRTALYYLRKALGDVIIYSNKGYQLKENISLWVDAREFDNLISQLADKKISRNSAILINRAKMLYQGSLCEGWYDSWVDDLRRQYEEKYLNILLSLAQIYARKSRLGQYIDIYEEIIKIDPFNEEHYRNLMVAYSRMRKFQNIKHTYARLEKLLANEFNKEPEPETQVLFKRLTSTR
ncbi:MAG: hypothetical protein N3A65_03090 [candidate division WOR-3 bacterium]|nr:hypothetical protein [candidate division WOR-3 bacterium]